MTMYKLIKGEDKVSRLPDYEYQSEGSHAVSPQQILINNPEILLELSELELIGTEVFLAIPEFGTDRGPIDLMIIGSYGEILVVETKLLRNPESARKVVAQVVDYVKALSDVSLEDLIRKIKRKNPQEASNLENDINFSFLADLTDQDLKELGVASLGHRRELLRGITNLGKTVDTAPSAPSRPAPPIAAPTVTPRAVRT